MPYSENRNLTGKRIRDTYQNLVQTSGSFLTDGLGNTVFDTSSCSITASWALNSITTSYTTVTSSASASWSSASLSSSYSLSSSVATSASWAPFIDTGTVLSTGSTYPITSSNSISASYSVSSSNSVSASWAPFTDTGTTLVTASTYQITSSNAVSASYAISSSQAISASWAPFIDTGTVLSTGSTYQITSSNSVSASYSVTSSNSVTASFALNGGGSGTTLFTASTYQITSSNSVSSSYAVSASNATSASWAPFTNTGTTLFTASTYQITSSNSVSSSYSVTSSWGITASYALAGNVQANNVPTSVTQSSYDITMREMSAPSSAAFQPGVIVAPLIGDYIGGVAADSPASILPMVFWHLDFVDNSGTVGATTASLAMYQTRVPQSFNGGMTHSFQFYPKGIVGESPVLAKVYWILSLYALTSSLSPASNLYSAPILVETKFVTSSLAGGMHDSGSIITTSSYFNDSNDYLKGGSLMFLSLKRVVPWLNDTTYDPGSRHYTASVAMVSSRLNWNVA